MYKASLNHGEKVYEGKGKTIFDALSSIPLDWTGVKTKGVITVSEGKNEYSRLFYLRPLRRLFANKFTRQAWSKNLNYLLETKGSVHDS